MSIPRHLRYTWDYEWLVVDEGHATVGITAFAAEALGAVVHLRLPEAGTWVEAGESCGQIESRNAVSGLYAPASGRVLEVNPALADNPGVVNAAPCTGGWLFRLRVENIAGALTPDAYAAHCAHTQGDPPMTLFNQPLHELDPEVAAAVDAELERQQSTLEMIASENFAPVAVLEAQGSVLTNKYAEGYPGRRYYGGCEHVDVAEQIAIDRVKELFGAAYANVQPHSGASANQAALFALAQPGDTILGLDLAHGGHLTHGMKINFSGKQFNVVPYHVDTETGLVDMAELERLAKEHRPRVIIAGWSAYPRQLDFAEFRRIADEVGAYLWVDMAHFAGLVAAGLHPNPVPYADVVTSTTHKTLGGPRGGIILARSTDFAKKLNSSVFPGFQGGPLEHVIAAKAVSFKVAASEEFKERQRRTVEGAQILAERLTASDAREAGVNVLSGGTDVHLLLVDLRQSELDGQQAEDRLHEVGITVNRNAVPNDPRPPMVTSGLRIGTPALATRGFQAEDFAEVADVIAEALKPSYDAEALKARVTALADKHPLYPGL